MATRSVQELPRLQAVLGEPDGRVSRLEGNTPSRRFWGRSPLVGGTLGNPYVSKEGREDFHDKSVSAMAKTRARIVLPVD